jgi:hypothetical protein
MKQSEKAKAILHIRPNAQFVLRELEIEWLDETQTQPSEEEIKAGWVAYQEAQIAEAEAKVAQKAALLDRLGITEDEAKLLLA